jgi:hypothetical protein
MKARTELGWRPVWSIAQALMATVGWYRAHLAGRDMWRYSLDQIGGFETSTLRSGADERTGVSDVAAAKTAAQR